MRVRQRSPRYLDELVDLSCGPDLLAQRLFPNAKEITESFGAYNAVRNRLRLLWQGEPGLSRVMDFSLRDRRVAVVVVGDGSTPRTAATFAYRSGWDCYSVDPRLRGRYNIDRLTVVPAGIEDFQLHHPGPVVLVAVHSHAPLEVAAANVTGTQRVVIAIPCCVPQRLGREADIEYQDWAIWSPHRTVKLWREP